MQLAEKEGIYALVIPDSYYVIELTSPIWDKYMSILAL